jgi:hypothetical protein
MDVEAHPNPLAKAWHQPISTLTPPSLPFSPHNTLKKKEDIGSKNKAVILPKNYFTGL